MNNFKQWLTESIKIDENIESLLGGFEDFEQKNKVLFRDSTEKLLPVNILVKAAKKAGYALAKKSGNTWRFEKSAGVERDYVLFFTSPQQKFVREVTISIGK